MFSCLDGLNNNSLTITTACFFQREMFVSNRFKNHIISPCINNINPSALADDLKFGESSFSRRHTRGTDCFDQTCCGKLWHGEKEGEREGGGRMEVKEWQELFAHFMSWNFHIPACQCSRKTSHFQTRNTQAASP